MSSAADGLPRVDTGGSTVNASPNQHGPVPMQSFTAPVSPALPSQTPWMPHSPSANTVVAALQHPYAPQQHSQSAATSSPSRPPSQPNTPTSTTTIAALPYPTAQPNHTQLPVTMAGNNPPSIPISHYSPPQLPPVQLPIGDKKFTRKHAWKYEGYPDFSEWMDSSHDFFVVRRFGKLNARVLLAMQDKISQREELLETLDRNAREVWFDENDPKTWANSRNDSVRFDALQPGGRAELIDEIKYLLKEYNEYLIAYSTLRNRHTADDHQVKNLKTWFLNHPGAIVKQETKFADHRGDLFSMASRHRSFVRRLFESSRLIRLSSIFKARSFLEKRVTGQNTHYQSDEGLDAFTNLIVLFVGLVMLLAPLWWLNYVNADTARLGIISGFVIVFSSLLYMASVSRSFEIMAATAAYAAVLMVFMQKSGDSTPGIPTWPTNSTITAG